MCIEIPNHAQLDSFCRFKIKMNDYPSKSIYKWMLLGYFDDKLSQYHFIADSDDELELRIWADTHGIKVES